MNDVAIRAENLSKRYRIGLKEELPDTLLGAMSSWLKAPLANFRDLRKLSHFHDNGRNTPDIIWALKDVSFEVKQGEVVGIIGRNGAGKSTLLKILSRITEPTSGRAVINGRVSSLLEVGTGFHPELTGRENVYLNGTVLGMSKAEVDRKFDEIVNFSGVEKFIDTPVKRYSSGMQVRLAFSVAAHLEPEILLVDEVLAVGDAEFQKKCLGKMGEVAAGGRTVLFVSHRMEMIESLCKRAFLLESGSLVLKDSARTVVNYYLTKMIDTAYSISLAKRTDREGSGEYRFTKIWFTTETGELAEQVRPGQVCYIHALLSPAENPEPLTGTASISVYDQRGDRLFILASMLIDKTVYLDGETEVIWRIDRLQLCEGEYPCNVFLARSSSGSHVYGVIDSVQTAFVLRVAIGDYYETGRVVKGRGDKFFVDFELSSRRFTEASE